MGFASYFTVIILCFINLINYMDRYTIAAVLLDIEKFYSFTDSQAGLLQTCFLISFLATAPIFGYLGDRYKRKYIIMGGVLFWSITTFLGSIVPREYPFLFFATRLCVGVGEASYTTVAPTLIADLFPRELRTRVLAIFYFAIPVGSGLGFGVGSGVSNMTGDWRWALRVTPPLGVLSVICVFFYLAEPNRGDSDGAISLQKSSFKRDFGYIARVKTYVFLTLGITFNNFTVGALAWWVPAYMEFAYKMNGQNASSSWIGFIFGGITIFSGIVGVMSGSMIAQRLRERFPRVDPLVCGISVLLAIPLTYIAIGIPHISPITTWFLLCFAEIFLSMQWALVADITLYVIVPNRRAIAQAVQLSITHLFGDASSPYIVGQLSDWFADGERAYEEEKYKSLQASLFLASLMLIASGFAFLFSSSFIEKDAKNCKNDSIDIVSQNGNSSSLNTLVVNDEDDHISVKNVKIVSSDL